MAQNQDDQPRPARELAWTLTVYFIEPGLR